MGTNKIISGMFAQMADALASQGVRPTGIRSTLVTGTLLNIANPAPPQGDLRLTELFS